MLSVVKVDRAGDPISTDAYFCPKYGRPTDEQRAAPRQVLVRARVLWIMVVLGLARANSEFADGAAHVVVAKRLVRTIPELEVPEVCVSIEAAQILCEKVREDRPGARLVTGAVTFASRHD